MTDPVRGLGITGYFDPSHEDEFDLVAAEWFIQTGFQLKEGKPEDDILRAMTERVTNKFLRFKPGDEKVAGLWQAVKDAFYAGYIETAKGLALELLVAYRNLERSAATNATGHLVFSGPNGTTIPAGTVVEKFNTSDLTYTTDREVIIGSAGAIAVPATATGLGEDFNTPQNTLTVIQTPIVNVTVNNPNSEEEYVLGPEPADQYDAVPNTAVTTNYQLITTSSLTYPVNIEKVSFFVKNLNGGDETYDLQVLVYNHSDGTLLGRSVLKRIALTEDEEQEVEFIGLDIDVQPYSNIRVAVVNHATSDGDIGVGMKTVGGGAGLWYLNSVNDDTVDAMIRITSSTKGAFDNGLAAQSDESLEIQYRNVWHNAAGFLPNGLWSRLMMLDGMRAVKIYPNPSNVEKLVAPGLTVAANRVAVVVDASTDPDLIAYEIAKAGCGILTDGDVLRLVDGAGNHQEEIRFYYAQKEFIRFEIQVFRSDKFLVDGKSDDAIRDVVVDYVGGFNTQGTIKNGLTIGENVSNAHLCARIIAEVPDIVDVVIKMSIDGNQLDTAGIPIDAIKRAFTTPSLISVI